MKTKTKVLLSFAALLTAFAAGRYAAPESTKTQSNVQVETKTDTQTKTDVERDRQRETTVTEITLPDGRTEKTTKTVENTVTKKKTDVEKTDGTSTDSKTSTETVRGSSPVTISGLMGTSFSLSAPVYGIAVTRPILGPATIGIWGISTGVFGLAIGLTF